MISNKDLRVEGSNLIINGEKHPLDPAVIALTKRANIVQGKFSALDARLDAIEALEKTASGNPISLTGVAAAYAMSNIMTIEPIQSGSGDPSPTNVRPISGISEAVATRCGFNIWDEEWELGLYNYTDGSKYENTNRIRCKNPIPCEPNTSYYFRSSVTAPNSLRICFYDDLNNFISSLDHVQWNVAHSTPSNARYMTWCVIEVDITTYSNDICINISDPNKNGQYEPYTGATASITFGQTVYGGSVNFKTGEVTVTHANIASYNGESINEPWLSSIDKYVSGATPTTGAQVVYPLTTPTTLTLTPAELELLKGANTISGNGVNINIGYIGR